MAPTSARPGVAQTRLPTGACDCHLHVYDATCPVAPGAALNPPPASVADYRRVQACMGTTRAVLVTPSTYGADNRPMLAGLAQLGDQGRGVAVIAGDESDAHLLDLHTRGVRGVRINLSLGVTNGPDAIEPIAARIAPLGWHLQLLMPVAQLVALAPVLRRLPVDLVFDHFGRLTPALCPTHAAHALLVELLGGGRTWVKLSGGYLVSPTARVDDPALDPLARRFIDAAPERVLWGSDWPHATALAGHHPMPDDAAQIDRLAHWAGDAATLRRILVDNPARLYGFPSFSTPH